MNAKLLAFCFQSLYRGYGAAFLRRVVLPHPVATLRGMARYAHGGTNASQPWKGGPGSLVGLGFCLKPLVPACPSGRANHNCMFFESGHGQDLAPCRECLIRIIGQQALDCGSALYLMTSARDILQDVLQPTLERRGFSRAVLVMCRYSFEPMRLALAICDIEAQLFPFNQGDCRDYSTWLRADVGDKPEQTILDTATYRALTRTLAPTVQSAPRRQLRKEGNIYRSL